MITKTRKKVKSSLSPLILLVLIFIMPSRIFADEYDNEASFTRIYSSTINGDIAATGSPIMCAKKSDGTCDWNYDGYLYDINPLTLHDGDTTVFPLNSGGAILKLPSDVNGSDILWAKLYWQGHIFGLGDSSDFNNAIASIDSVKMLDPNGIEHNLTANSSDIYYYGYDDKNVINSNSKGYRYFYQASTDVTSIIKNNYSPTNNYFIVGNINATMIKDTYYIKDTKLDAYVKWGNWGGWSLIVAYKDPNSSLKNINLYDGFKFLLPPFGKTASLIIDLPPNSFYTPQFGAVQSKTIMFSAGAEKKISADSLEMYSDKDGGGYKTLFNDLNPSDNQMNDSITYLNNEINSTRIFNAGIDLDTYDSSDILNNGQTTTSIRVTMTANTNSADQAFVGFVGISNDIYQPKICYIETLYNDDNIEINSSSTINIGDTIQARLTIRNDDNESASNVKILHSFEDNKTIYKSNSTIVNNIDADGSSIGDINQTDAYGDDLVDFNTSNKSLLVRLGRGANNIDGGLFQPNDTTYTIFKSKINTDQNISFNYETSYIFNIVGQNFTFNGPLPKCTDFNNTIHGYYPLIGSFNVINKNYSGGIVPEDIDSSINALYTQIANKDFNITVVSLNSDLITPKSINALLTIDLIKNPDSESQCLTNPTLVENNVTLDNQAYTSLTFNYPKADKDLRFRIKYLVDQYGSIIDWSTIGACSNNTGTIYNDYACIWGLLTSKVYDNAICNEGNGYPEDQCPCAQECNPASNSSPNHNEECIQCVFGNPNLSKSTCSRDNFAIRPDKFNFQISNSSPCKAGNDYNITFKAVDLNNNQTIDYNETIGSSFKIDINNTKNGCKTGVFNPSLKTGWSFTDGNYTITSNYNETGIVNIKIQEINGSEFAHVDHNDTTDVQRLITPYDKNITFIPDHFSINAVLTSGGNNFTYISTDLNMSSTLEVNITAETENNTTTTNYSSACYAQTTDYNISYTQLNISPTGSLSKILYRETNTSIGGSQTINSNINLTLPKTIFSTDYNGTASLHIKINFDRNQTKATNPFVLNVKDINATDTNNTNGNTILDQNTTFYYGRVHAPDYRFKGNAGNATIYYEVYSNQNKSIRNSFGINGSESVDSVNWYVNTLHTNSDGNVTRYSSLGDVKFNNNTSDFTSSKNISQGKEAVNLTVQKTPYKDKIDINSSSWLIYNPTDFMVEFFNANDKWAGEGKLGKTVDLNISTLQNRRLDW